MCLRDLCVTTTCFFTPSGLEIGGGVFKRLSEAKKNHFLTKKWPFLAVLSMRNGEGPYRALAEAGDDGAEVCQPCRAAFAIVYPECVLQWHFWA